MAIYYFSRAHWGACALQPSKQAHRVLPEKAAYSGRIKHTRAAANSNTADSGGERKGSSRNSSGKRKESSGYTYKRGVQQLRKFQSQRVEETKESVALRLPTTQAAAAGNANDRRAFACVGLFC